MTDAILAEYGWQWREHPEYRGLRELYDRDGRMLGWIYPRPHYCDRGHWQVGVELPDIDHADGFSRYYMRHATAEQELIEFLAWRLHKRRAE